MFMPQITRIIRRSSQGATQPFICQADDGKTYYVKGKSASTGERIREWMGANLAMAFGLNVPPMALLEVPAFLIQSSGDTAKSALGIGYAVGSQQILSTSELRHEEIDLIPQAIQRQILLFDYWLHNEDRTLSRFGGNPNLLWHKPTKSLYAIDYNLVLQNNFDVAAFWETHVFAKTAKLNTLNDAEKQDYQAAFQVALSQWENYWQQLPEQWLDENESTQAFDEAAIKQRLQQDTNGNLWSIIKP